MEEEPVDVIRESTRNLLQSSRRFQRDEESDNRRCLDNSRATPDSVHDVANRLKTKSPVTASELCILKNALMDNPKNINIVLKIHGSLRGLVRELSGNDVNKQCEAAGCICNLALGDARTGVTLAKAAGLYLNAPVNCLHMELAIRCIWSLGNIAGSGVRACEVLIAQGSLTKLIELLDVNNNDIRDAAVYSLTHFAYQLKDDFRSEYVNKLFASLTRLNATTPSTRLLFILSCHKDFNASTVSENFLQKMIQDLSVSIPDHIVNCNKSSNCCMTLYLIRCLANICVNETVCAVLLSYFLQTDLTESFRTLLQKSDTVKNSLMWFLGNLLNYCSENVLFNSFLSDCLI